jgi:hypothetical protein
MSAIDDDVSFEQWIFARSPFGAMATSFLIFAFAAGSFLVVAGLVHYRLIDTDGFLGPSVMPAIAISLLTSTALGMQRYTRIRERADQGALALIVTDNAASALAAIRQPASGARMVRATIVGALAGAALTFIVMPSSVLHDYPAIFAWNAAFTTFLGVLFARGVVLTSRASRAFAHVIAHELKIDLLHVDRLAVIGRRCARNALVWFTAAAVACLFFVGGGIHTTTIIVILAICAGMGLWIFVQPVAHVHRRIRAAKSIELDRIRNEIGPLQDEATRDASAAMRLQGLLAYEARIQAVHEWPFDLPTLVRVAAYVLIPAIPWIGRAMSSDLIQRLAH